MQLSSAHLNPTALKICPHPRLGVIPSQAKHILCLQICRPQAQGDPDAGHHQSSNDQSLRSRLDVKGGLSSSDAQHAYEHLTVELHALSQTKGFLKTFSEKSDDNEDIQSLLPL